MLNQVLKQEYFLSGESEYGSSILHRCTETRNMFQSQLQTALGLEAKYKRHSL